MDTSALSPEAQGLAQALENAANNSVATRGYGYAQIREDVVGGLGPNRPTREHYRSDEDYEAAVAAYKPTEARIGLEDLQAGGWGVVASAGDDLRMIAIPGVRLTRDAK